MLSLCLFRGSLPDPFHEWGPAADPGGSRALPASSPYPILHRGKLHDLLRQGTVLSLQCQWQNAQTHGGGGQHQGEDSVHICSSMHVEVLLHMCVCTTSVQKVLVLIKGILTVWDSSKVRGRHASGQTVASHLFLFTFTRMHQRKWSF